MARGQPQIAHLLRRAAFGASPDELASFDRFTAEGVVQYLLNYERQPDDVDSKIGNGAYLSVTATRAGAFSPNINIEDARQRWLFRMVHSPRPLQEKMALFWHNHFATAYTKVAGLVGAVQGTKMMALRSGELPGPQGQIDLLRTMALGSFRDLLIEVARDPAMLVWLDGRTNTRLRPQENFGREVMELFTFGIGNYTEQDVYAAARVFTGWNLRLTGTDVQDPNAYYSFFYNAPQHDTSEKTFTFPVYPDGRKTIPSRSTADGMQDGIDLLTALATHPETARRLSRKLWNFLISEVQAPDEQFVAEASRIYLRFGTQIKPVVEYIFRSRWFQDRSNWFARYAWPVEFVVRAIKEIGWAGLSVDVARTPLTNMGQTLFEPPDVAGWSLGQDWFSSGAMLARMNFASTLAANQRFNLARAAAVAKSTPDDFLGFFTERLSVAEYDREPYNALRGYLLAGGAWTGSETQLQTKAAGLTRLIIGSSEYQFV
jgi:uncharacterized protein (DUF1800 family)